MHMMMNINPLAALYLKHKTALGLAVYTAKEVLSSHTVCYTHKSKRKVNAF